MRQIFFIMIILLIISCSSYRYNEKVILYDTVIVKINYDGNFEEVLPSSIKKTSREVTLYESGDEFSFKKGEIIRLIVDGVDFGNNTICIFKSEDSDSIKVKVVELGNYDIKLQRKCQTIIWKEPNFLPKINLEDVVEQQQIVITPTFNSKCEKTGYQIRYGSVERGCQSEAKYILEKFNQCVGQIRKIRKISNKDNLAKILFE